MKKKIAITTLASVLAFAVLSSCTDRDIGEPETEPSATQTEAPAPTLVPTPTSTPTPTPTPEPEGDTVSPFFININRDAWLAVGNEFDINDFISYIDDQDADIDLQITGEVDTSTLGSYHLDLVITDDWGNTASDSMNVTVFQPADTGDTSNNTGTTTDNATPFSDFIASYPGDNVHYGIDVSKWQGAIDWNQVAEAGCEFAFVRAGWSSEGEFHEDEYFRTNMEGAAAAGIPIGVYVYTTDNTEEYVTLLADTICDLCAGYNVSLPIVFDWENFFGNFQKYNLSIADINYLYDVFDAEVQNRGMTSMLYGSKFIMDVIWDDDIENVWLAHYTSQTDYAGAYAVWQQSCTGTIPGIDAYVDMDLYYGELPGGANG